MEPCEGGLHLQEEVKEEEEEEEWVLLSGGIWVDVFHKYKDFHQKYKGDCIVKHVLKLPGKNLLTWEVLKNHLTALGFSIEEPCRLTYADQGFGSHIGVRNDYAFQLMRDRFPNPVTLYHSDLSGLLG